MTKLEKLHQKAVDNGICVFNYEIFDGTKGMCAEVGDLKTIALDKKQIKTKAEETEILAEEIGHYETGSLYILESTANTPFARNNRIKCEAKAMHWSYKELVPPEDIERFIPKCIDMQELAELLGVTFMFLCDALNYYRTIGIDFIFPVYE